MKLNLFPLILEADFFLNYYLHTDAITFEIMLIDKYIFS